MNRLDKLLAITIFLITGFFFTGISFPAIDLQKFSDVMLQSSSANDGDSFLVEIDEKPFFIRLYFVDCPETFVNTQNDAQRVREQTWYFGLPDASRTVHFGSEAKAFVERILQKPFITYTAFASALGRSSKGRIYAFITTSEGDDLASLLVKNGLARTHGMGRETPNGIPRSEMSEMLHDLETSAMLKRIGIWSESNPDQIAEFRAKQRSEDSELQELQYQVKKSKSPKFIFNINTSTENELQTIKGIGPVIAKRIINGRLYKSVDDLLKVKGIGAKKLEMIRPYVMVGEE